MRIRLLVALALGSALTVSTMASAADNTRSSNLSEPAIRRAHLHHAAALPHRHVERRGRHSIHARVTTAHLERTAAVERTAVLRRTEVARQTGTVTRIRWVPPLRGSLASLMRQNERDTAEGLVRIEDDTQLDQMEAAGDIVPLPASASLRVNPDLPVNRRYCRPWTEHFLADLAASHYARFHRPLQVNSAVRTVAFQRHLLMINGNAAPAEGDIASPHLTGAAVDIGKRGLTFSEIAWMRAWLLPLQTAGKIDVEEEFYQSCFHITVYRSYQRPAAPQAIARRRNTTTLLAASVR